MAQRLTPEQERVKAAVLAEIAAGDSLSRVASRYRVNKGTVSRWKNGADMPVPTEPTPTDNAQHEVLIVDAVAANATVAEPIATQKRREVGEQLYGLMHETLAALRVQARLFGDEQWLRAQNAGDLATLHGVGSDKLARLLLAFQNGSEREDNGD